MLHLVAEGLQNVFFVQFLQLEGSLFILPVIVMPALVLLLDMQ